MCLQKHYVYKSTASRRALCLQEHCFFKSTVSRRALCLHEHRVYILPVGASWALAEEHPTVSQEDRGSSLPAVVSKLGQFHSLHIACVFVQAVGPFCFSFARENERSHTVVNVQPVMDLPTVEKDNSKPCYWNCDYSKGKIMKAKLL